MYVLYIVVCLFALFLLAIVLSVLLRYIDSDYPFGIFKLFLKPNCINHSRVWLFGLFTLKDCINHSRVWLFGLFTLRLLDYILHLVFQSFDYERHLMNVIPEMRGAH